MSNFAFTPWTVACQALLSMEFSRQENWSELPFPSPGDLPHPETEPKFLESPASPALAGRCIRSQVPVLLFILHIYSRAKCLNILISILSFYKW